MDDKEKQMLTTAVKYLSTAMSKAQAYLDKPQSEQAAEVIQVYYNHLVTRIGGVEKAVASINRRHKNEDLQNPEEVEEAADLICDLQIRQAELVNERKDQERGEAIVAAQRQNEENQRSSQMQVVVTKPPLPPLPIPRFAGDALQYSNFITIFNETVHKNATLGPAQKLVYLQSYVDGEAKRLIERILVMDENYEVAKEILRSNFGHSSQTISFLYDKLHEVGRAKNEPYSIRDTYNEVESILQMLQHAGVEVNSDKYLQHEVMKKWPFQLIKQLVRTTDFTLQQFRDDLKKEIELQIQLTQVVGYVQPGSASSSQRSKPYNDRPPRRQGSSSSSSAPTSGVAQASYKTGKNWASSNAVSTETSQKPTSEAKAQQRTAHCPFCKEQHYAEECERYKTSQQRMDQLGPKRCQKCFREIHEGSPCIRTMKCRYCSSYEHNRALCPTKYGEAEAKCLLTNEKHKNEPPGLFMTFLVPVHNPVTNQKTGMRILLDPASGRTALTERAAKKIGVSLAKSTKQKTLGMGGKEVEAMTEQAVRVDLGIRDGEPISISTRLTKSIADNVPVYGLQEFRERYPECDAYFIPPTGEGCPIDLIIGSDMMLRFLQLDKSIFVNQACQLLATKFGHLIMAENPKTCNEAEIKNSFTFFTHEEDIIKIMWDLDLVGMKGLAELDTEHEEKALEMFYESIKKVNGRYEIKWPWRTNPPNLNENYGLAMGRLRTLLKKLQEQPQLLSAYDKIINDQIIEGVLEEVPKGAKAEGAIIHYIPHHAVVMLEKSTPVRIVCDAKATTSRSRSLNDNMLKGSKWLNSTVASLLRFRKFKKALTADIRHAFHQISISPEDRDAVRFVWVHDTKKPPTGDNIRVLRFCRVAFGIVASPFLLYATIQHHLRNQNQPYTEEIRKEMYADNLLISLPNSANEIEFYQITKSLFEEMSMNITKWKSNSSKLMQHIPVDDALSEEEISVLGLAWQSEIDFMGLRYPKIDHLRGSHPTKRIVLKTMASIFDPLGWVAPFVLQIRIFLRKLWKQQKTWDTPLQDEDLQTWSRFIEEIKQLQSIKFTRMYFVNEFDEENCKYQIHTFVDASGEAIGAVTYVRQVSQPSRVAFLMAKTRLAPNAKLSIPRLEFYALVMGVRLQKYVIESLDLKNSSENYVWSDSKCVLAWISSNKLLPVAVEKHLGEIKNANVHQFRYVPSAMNAADVASRGSTLTELKSSSWLRGPDWLRREEDWPTHVPDSCEVTEELEKEKVLFIQGQNTIQLESPFGLEMTKFSQLKALLRRTAYCIWLLHHYLKKQIIPVGSPIDYNYARIMWIRYDQKRNGATQPALLATIRHFKAVQLFTDQFGLLRCKSRMENSKLPWTAVEPIVLVKGSYLTELIVLDIHERNFHVGTDQTLATLKEHYWLIHGRREVYRIIHTKCFKCKRYNAKPFKAPEIAPLPEFRVTPTSHPFENTGIDIFGPIYVYSTSSGNKEKVKRWVLLFTCLVVRAIHLEILVNLDTQDILCAIKRFTARRGTPALILSDNAPQFHLVNGTLQELWQSFYENEGSNKYFAENNLVWKFTPQSAPWMGGAYERLVGVTKNAFKRTYAEQTVNEREFSTAIVEIEAVINNRPIAYVDREISSQLLTPNHFLRVKFPAIPINIESRDQGKLSTKENLLVYWKATENDLNIYWRIWSEQYLLALRDIRVKSSRAQILQPKIGEVVLIIDPSQKRGYWRKAIIERLISSGDGKIRSAQLKVSTGTRMIRPITKIASLELLDDLPNSDSSLGVVSGEDVEISTDLSETGAGPAPVVFLLQSSSPKNQKRMSLVKSYGIAY